MAVLAEAIYARLVAYDALNTAVGGRIYAKVMPQNPTLPAVTYDVSDQERVHVMGGASGTKSAIVDVTGWAETFGAASVIGEHIRAALQDWSGVAAGVTVDASFLEDEDTEFQFQPRAHGVSFEFKVWSQE